MATRLRKKNKPSLNAREANLHGDSPPESPTKSNFSVSATPTAPAQPEASSFAKTASHILTPDMTDIEKLQKLKEWILADQHPSFTSAPKVAHLLKLMVSASGSNENSNASGSSGEQERPLSSIPLAERLSSPKTGHPAGGGRQNGVYKNDNPSNLQDEKVQDDVSMKDANHEKKEDVDMADSRYKETTGPLLTPTHTEPPQPIAYNRPEDSEHKTELYKDGQSPRNEGRGYGGYMDNHSRAGNGHYEPRGRYRGNNYNNQGNRRFSLDDREQADQRYHDFNRGRDYDRRSEYAVDDRRNDARNYGDSPPKYGRQSYDGRPGEPARARVPSNQNLRPLAMDTSADAQNDESTKFTTKDAPESAGVAAETDTTIPLIDATMEPASASPTSVGNGPPQSLTESVATIPAATSPPRSEIPLDTPPEQKEQEEKSAAKQTPPRSTSASRRDFKDLRDTSRDRDIRPNFGARDADRYHQDTRPRADSYQKYPGPFRPYDRSLPPREENKTFPGRDTYYRPPPPIDDRRLGPREVGYPDEAGYAPRRDYRPGEWDNKRRDVDRPLDRPYERDRDRDIRGPMVPQSDARGPRIPHTAALPSRGYPPERDGPRGLNARNAHDPYPPHPPAHDPRGYDREPYGAPLLPPTGSYLREAPRVRPRSSSPPLRRDYRPDPRPPAKRPRGPDDGYILPPPAPAGGHYTQPNYGPLAGRGQEYSGDRRSIPSGPAQGAYYRADDRAQGRY